MHWFSDLPRIFCEVGRAQSLASRVDRLGPVVPVVPAAARTWQPPHPPTPVKIDLPTAGVGETVCGPSASAPVSCPGRDATAATYAATSWAFCPVSSLAGITPWLSGNWIQ